MRQLMFDEISREDMDKIADWMENNTESSPMAGLFWINIPSDLLDPHQYQEKDDQPFCFAVELGDTWTKFELLIRSRTNLRSAHTRYANARQQRYILEFAYDMVEELKIIT